MKQEIPWNRLIIEAIVIVGSILLAFAIDAWWDDLGRRESEREYLQALVDDYAEGLRRSQDYQRILPMRRTAIDAALSRLSEYSDIESRELEELLAPIRIIARPFEFERAAVEVMTSSGGFQAIDDPQVRLLITQVEVRKEYFLASDLTRTEFYYDFFTDYSIRNRQLGNSQGDGSASVLLPMSEMIIWNNILQVMAVNNESAVRVMETVRETMSEFLSYANDEYGISPRG